MRISGLAEGDHDFSFELDQQFFASLEEPEVTRGKVNADVVLEKKPGVLALHFKLAGEIEVMCDRCLEPFMAGIESSQTIFVKSGDTPGEIEDNVIMIHKDDHEIEVGQLLYEFIVLGLPYRRIHPEDKRGIPGCNPEMLKKIEDHSTQQADHTDPRWDVLKGIIKK